MPFIPADKMKALREAAAKGDERAKAIINLHFQKKDYSKDLEEYFKPKEEPAPASAPAQGNNIPDMSATNPGSMPEEVSTGNPKLDEWLRSNNIHKSDEDYEEALEEYYGEYPDERPETNKIPGVTLKLDGLKDYQQEAKEEVDLTKDIAGKIIETIQSCDQILLALMQNDEIDSTVRKGAMTSLSEIKQSLFDAADKIKKIKQSLCKKEGE